MSKLIPELLVSNLASSLHFWIQLLGFKVLYDRPAEGFVFLKADSLEVMLEEMGHGRNWKTAVLSKPFGRGINFQMEGSWKDALERIRDSKWPLYLEPEEKWYRIGKIEKGQRQFLVQDPDGYLLRLCQPIGERTLQ